MRGAQAVALEEDVDGDELVSRAQRGDQSAFRRLYTQYYDVVYAYGRMMLKDPHEAEDVTQDVFVRVLRMLPRYQTRAGCPFRVLLLRIARNRAIDYLRKQKPCEVEPADQLERRLAPVDHDLPVSITGLSDAQLALALKRLPIGQRQVLVLRYMLGLSTDEVADVMDATPKAVRNLQYRGLSYLRSALA